MGAGGGGCRREREGTHDAPESMITPRTGIRDRGGDRMGDTFDPMDAGRQVSVRVNIRVTDTR